MFQDAVFSAGNAAKDRSDFKLEKHFDDGKKAKLAVKAEETFKLKIGTACCQIVFD